MPTSTANRFPHTEARFRARRYAQVQVAMHERDGRPVMLILEMSSTRWLPASPSCNSRRSSLVSWNSICWMQRPRDEPRRTSQNAYQRASSSASDLPRTRPAGHAPFFDDIMQRVQRRNCRSLWLVGIRARSVLS